MRLIQTPISHKSTLILWIDRVSCIRMPVVALRTVRRSGTNATSGRSIMWLRLSLGKRFWKRRRSFCIGGQRTETTFFAWSHRDSPGGFSQRCLLGRVCRFVTEQIQKQVVKSCPSEWQNSRSESRITRISQITRIIGFWFTVGFY